MVEKKNEKIKKVKNYVVNNKMNLRTVSKRIDPKIN